MNRMEALQGSNRQCIVTRNCSCSLLSRGVLPPFVNVDEFLQVTTSGL